MTTLGFIVATNNDEILEKNLLRSKIIRDKRYPLILQRGYRNIGKAYNEGLARIDSRIAVCLHQDVFLPDSWEDQALASLEQLETSNWGVLGVAGIKLVERRRELLGHVLDGRTGIDFGSPENLPAQVDTLDELLLVIRNDRSLLFDDQIPTTHLYGADICLQASCKGLGCFAISAYCHHNTIDSNANSPQFRMAVKYMQQKWKRRLPFGTTCTLVESRSVENLRRIVNNIGLQPIAHPIANKLRRLRKLRRELKRL